MSLDSNKTWYIAGPMSGLPKFNIPTFEDAAKVLRSQGLTVVSPAELDSPAVQEEAGQSKDGALINGKIGGETWGDMLARDVKIIADTLNGIVLLPGWQRSRGARLETFVGLLCGHDFAQYYNGEVWPISSAVVRSMMESNMPGAEHDD